MKRNMFNVGKFEQTSIWWHCSKFLELSWNISYMIRCFMCFCEFVLIVCAICNVQCATSKSWVAASWMNRLDSASWQAPSMHTSPMWNVDKEIKLLWYSWIPLCAMHKWLVVSVVKSFNYSQCYLSCVHVNIVLNEITFVPCKFNKKKLGIVGLKCLLNIGHWPWIQWTHLSDHRS